MKKLFTILLSLIMGSSLIAMDAQFGERAMRNARDAARQGLDLYAIVGVDKNTSQPALNSACRRKARELHPDSRSGNRDEFQRFNNAYAILRDSVTRREYDRARELIQNNRFGFKQRRQKFIENLRAYKNSIAIAATAAAATALAMTSQVVNCRDVAQAICSGHMVAPSALQLCADYVPSSMNCLMRML